MCIWIGSLVRWTWLGLFIFHPLSCFLYYCLSMLSNVSSSSSVLVKRMINVSPFLLPLLSSQLSSFFPFYLWMYFIFSPWSTANIFLKILLKMFEMFTIIQCSVFLFTMLNIKYFLPSSGLFSVDLPVLLVSCLFIFLKSLKSTLYYLTNLPFVTLSLCLQ